MYLCEKGSITRYEIKNLRIIISAGESPAFNKTLLTAKVEPQTKEVNKAKK